jgi:hypothetical protein
MANMVKVRLGETVKAGHRVYRDIEYRPQLCCPRRLLLRRRHREARRERCTGRVRALPVGGHPHDASGRCSAAAPSQLGIIKDVASLTYLAGADTTASAVRMFFLVMLVYPDGQAKAQAEVDRVVDPDRLPEVEDRERLPYVEAVVNERLR